MTEWMDEANCATTNPELFFPLNGDSAEPARKICAACPVAGECLEYALANDFQEGVWGGMSTVQRRQLMRKKTRT